MGDCNGDETESGLLNDQHLNRSYVGPGVAASYHDALTSSQGKGPIRNRGGVERVEGRGVWNTRKGGGRFRGYRGGVDLRPTEINERKLRSVCRGQPLAASERVFGSFWSVAKRNSATWVADTGRGVIAKMSERNDDLP